MGEIKIIKEKEGTTDYTFIGASLNLANPIDGGDKSSNGISDKKDKEIERELRRKARIAKLDKMKHKSKLTGGQNMQGHSPVYE